MMGARMGRLISTKVPPALYDLGKTRLFEHQAALSKLPVPLLEETMNRYLRSVEPLTTSAELSRTKELTGRFLREEGPVLQKRLEEKAKDESGWLLNLWNDAAYLTDREPVVFYVNYFYGFRDNLRNLDSGDMVQVGSNLVHGAVSFFKDLVEGRIVPDAVQGQYLCSHTFKYLFHACRVPGRARDETLVHPSMENRHIVVMHRYRFFVVNVLDREGGVLPVGYLRRALGEIVARGDETRDPVGILTTLDRDAWYQARMDLMKSEGNKELLDKIETSLFVLCLDGHENPQSIEEVSRMLWHGDGKNRFFDKSVQLIVSGNGKAGFNGEHSMMDGMVTSRLCETMLERLDKNELALGGPEVGGEEVEELRFTVSDETRVNIREAERRFAHHRDMHEFKLLEFREYGKNEIKAWGFSPDAYVQMAFQLAYLTMKGQAAATYESVHTRKYMYGRTEAGRSCSLESKKWAESMQAGSGQSAEAQYSLLREAAKAHSRHTTEASRGAGVDRHFLGLRSMVGREERVPEMFLDPVFARSSHWTLSTSQTSSEYYNTRGWGEVVGDGFGIPYSINNDHILVGVSSRMGQAGQLRQCIRDALGQMRALVEGGAVRGEL